MSLEVKKRNSKSSLRGEIEYEIHNFVFNSDQKYKTDLKVQDILGFTYDFKIEMYVDTKNQNLYFQIFTKDRMEALTASGNIDFKRNCYLKIRKFQNLRLHSLQQQPRPLLNCR